MFLCLTYELENNLIHVKSVIKATKNAAQGQVYLSKYFKGVSSSINEILKRSMTKELAVNLLRNGLNILAVNVDISKRFNHEKFAATFFCNVTKLPEQRILNSKTSIAGTVTMQYAIIVVDAVMMVLSTVGICETR